MRIENTCQNECNIIISVGSDKKTHLLIRIFGDCCNIHSILPCQLKGIFVASSKHVGRNIFWGNKWYQKRENELDKMINVGNKTNRYQYDMKKDGTFNDMVLVVKVILPLPVL